VIERRRFIRLLGGTAIAWPLAALAEPSGEMKRVGILNGNPENAVSKSRIAAVQQALRDAGWQEGRNISFEIRWGGADSARIDGHVADLVKLNPDVIFATNTPTLRSLKRATDQIPIVFAGLSDPIGDGIVTSLSKPGGNITGFTSFNAPIAGKWLELLRELSPATLRAGVIYNPRTAPHAIFLPVMQDIAPRLGMTVKTLPVSDEATIESAIDELAREPHCGVIALPDIFMTLHGRRTFELATRAGLPTVAPLRSFAEDGALASYGSDFTELFRQAARYVDRILRGAKPRDLPVQEPTNYELIINLNTAKALGLAVPPPLLARADGAIE
jgi:putative ABC transport system substrate-binding protein